MNRFLCFLSLGICLGLLAGCASYQEPLPAYATNADYAWLGNRIKDGQLTITVRLQSQVAAFQKGGQDAGYSKCTATAAVGVTQQPSVSTYARTEPPRLEFSNGVYFTANNQLVSGQASAVLFPEPILYALAKEADDNKVKLIIVDQ